MIFKSYPDTNKLRYKIDDMRYLRTAACLVEFAISPQSNITAFQKRHIYLEMWMQSEV